MSVDVNAVNERLNGLVTLLKAVGVDPNDAAGISKAVGNSSSARQLNDSQIEAIIQKLQMAQSEAPQIIAALEAHAEARSLGGDQKARKRGQSAPAIAPPEPEVDEDEDESEEDDDDGNYPMVGPGCSDDCSVISDMTTPTVCSGVAIPDEEHYREGNLPPMMIGGGAGSMPMMINPTKRKNLVSQVRPGVVGGPRRNMVAPPRGPTGGGAAAQRRNKSNHVVAKLSQDTPQPRPLKPRTVKKPTGTSSGEKKPLKKRPTRPAPPTGASSFTELTKSRSTSDVVDKPREAESDPFQAPPSDAGWNAFESQPAPSQGKSPTVIDNDGFLIGESFDPFARGADPFSSPAAASPAQKSPQTPRPAPPRPGALAAPNENHAPRRPRPSPSSKSKILEKAPIQSPPQQPLRKPKGAASGGRRTRRASLSM
jgi:hypothetical protein